MRRDKIKPRLEIVLDFFYPASSEWLRPYPRQTVKVCLIAYYNPDKIGNSCPTDLLRICVGEQDINSTMELNIPTSIKDYSNKIIELKQWLNDLPNPLTKSWLSEKGFKVF